jgi:tRNA/tmRNA/rRNA uracil-C5-methylase (TrmA/RlmC/RlmD family)
MVTTTLRRVHSRFRTVTTISGMILMGCFSLRRVRSFGVLTIPTRRNSLSSRQQSQVADKVVAQSQRWWRPSLTRQAQERTSPRFYSTSLMSLTGSNIDNQVPPTSTSLSQEGQEVASDLTTINTSLSEVKVPAKFIAYPFCYHEELLLKVETLTNLGMGICRTEVDTISEADLDSITKEAQPKVRRRSRNKKGASSAKDGRNLEADGVGTDPASSEPLTDETKSRWVVMVPNVIPGETVRVRVYRNYKTYSDADLLEVLEPSENRVTPRCPLFEKCGGCQYQHIDIETQRDWKRQQVQDLLQRVGQLDPATFPAVLPTCGTDETYNYRSKITPHYDAPDKGWGKKKEINNDDEKKPIHAIGFKEKTSRRLVDVPQCDIATKAINEKLTEVRQEVSMQAIEGTLRRPHKGATILLRDANEGVVTDPNQYVTTDVDGITFRFLAGNFFQNNPHMLPLMVQHVVEGALGSNRHSKDDDDKPMTHLIDCYCGSGLFCLTASKHFKVCVGIEVNEKAIDEARDTADLNGIKNCAFVAASAEAIFESHEQVQVSTSTEYDEGNANALKMQVRDFPRDQTVVVVDPPRKGCSPEFLDQLYSFSPRRVVYMSCDPSTQARDAKGLVANGYEIVSALPFDLFPQTRHIESLVIFERKL